MSKEFARTDSTRFLKLGKRSAIKSWRRARGIHSKIRRKRKGYPLMPEVGFKTKRSESGKLNGKMPILIHNLAELKLISKEQIAIIARIGAKKKMDLLKYAKEHNISLANAGESK
ncbi:MAG TPA: eL32 family ribosomal protein [Candidatus Nanoarchaeia archaeon]|nr:eL32 family ribosomal protein [Candidatus Nanoarchaeia archaeon]